MAASASSGTNDERPFPLHCCPPREATPEVPLIDNVLWGAVAKPARDADIAARQALNDKLHADERVDIAMVVISNGITLACKR